MSGVIKRAFAAVKRFSKERRRKGTDSTGKASSSSAQPSAWNKVNNKYELGPLRAAGKEFNEKVHKALNDVKDARNKKIATEGDKYHLWYKTKGREIEVVLANKEPPRDYKTAGEDVLGSVTFNASDVRDKSTWERLERYALPDSNEGWEAVFK